MDKTEFSDFAEKMQKISGNALSFENALTSFDTDGDGALNSDELEAFVSEMASKPSFQEQYAMSMYQNGNSLDGQYSGMQSALTYSQVSMLA